MDICKCLNEKCPIRSNCLRFMCSPSLWQAYSMFTINKNGSCDFYLKIEDNSNEHKEEISVLNDKWDEFNEEDDSIWISIDEYVKKKSKKTIIKSKKKKNNKKV